MLRPVENVVVPISRQLQLIQLNERTCKWPNGDPLSEDFHFCGNDSAETGPYCRYHSRIAFQPASERRVASASSMHFEPSGPLAGFAGPSSGARRDRDAVAVSSLGVPAASACR